MNIYKRRYLNALKHCAKINRYLRKGYHVIHEGQPIKSGFVLQDGELLLPLSDNVFIRYYENTPVYDHGYYTKISDWTANFLNSFEVFMPSAKVKL